MKKQFNVLIGVVMAIIIAILIGAASAQIGYRMGLDDALKEINWTNQMDYNGHHYVEFIYKD